MRILFLVALIGSIIGLYLLQSKYGDVDREVWDIMKFLREKGTHK